MVIPGAEICAEGYFEWVGIENVRAQENLESLTLERLTQQIFAVQAALELVFFKLAYRLAVALEYAQSHTLE